jgi:hypothetical protein
MIVNIYLFSYSQCSIVSYESMYYMAQNKDSKQVCDPIIQMMINDKQNWK